MAYTAIPAVSSSSSGGGGADSTWQAAGVAALQALDASLTGFKYLPLGIDATLITPAGTPSGDAEKVGGAASPPSGTTRYLSFGVFPTAKTGHWAIYVRGIIAAPVAARFAQFGVSNAALTTWTAVGTRFAGSATKYEMEMSVGPARTLGTLVADGLVHDFIIRGDGTNTYFYVDGVLDITQINTGATDGGGYVYLSNTIANDVVSHKLIIGFVQP